MIALDALTTAPQCGPVLEPSIVPIVVRLGRYHA